MIHNEDNCWNRLESVINWSNMTINHFALHIGLTRSENIYQIKRGNNKISRKLAEMVVAHFPDISLSWLLTGKGDMFCCRSSMRTHIDLYNFDVEGSIRDISKLSPTSKIMLPEFISADFAMIFKGDSMGQLLPPNSLVLLKQIDPTTIIPGKEYVIVTHNIALLRSVRLPIGATSNEKLRLVAVQKEQYDDIYIESEDIIMAYKVAAKLIINS